MRYLLIGSGVLGGFLAHEMYSGGKDISLFVTERRYSYIKQNGLTIWHIRQKNQTVDKINVVTNFDDSYDVVIIVVQKSQLNSVLEIIKNNKNIKTLIIIGNNCEVSTTYKEIHKNFTTKPEILFGFLSCGGRRENDIIYNWHADVCNITLGPVLKTVPQIFDCKNITENTNLNLNIRNDMDAWLKYHAAVITPICLAIEYHKGKTSGLLFSKALRYAINAVKECNNFYANLGMNYEPFDNLSFLKIPTWLIQFVLAVFLPTKTGHIVGVDHAIAGQKEIELLKKELVEQIKNANAELPNFSKLLAMK